jgi:hypothetical protein
MEIRGVQKQLQFHRIQISRQNRNHLATLPINPCLFLHHLYHHYKNSVLEATHFYLFFIPSNQIEILPFNGKHNLYSGHFVKFSPNFLFFSTTSWLFLFSVFLNLGK